MSSNIEQEMLSYFPDSLFEMKKYLKTHSLEDILEIRVRLAKPIEIKKKQEDVFIPQIVTNDEMIRMVENLCHHSIYAMQSCINQGFLTIKGRPSCWTFRDKRFVSRRNEKYEGSVKFKY